MSCEGCPPYVSGSIIDIFERVVSGAWGTPSRGTPDWIDYDESAAGTSSSSIGVSAIGPSTGWGRIILILNTTGSSPTWNGAMHHMQLEIDEIADLDEFALAFDLVVSPDSSRQGLARATIIIGGTGDSPTGPILALPLLFEHFDVAPGEININSGRDALGGIEHTVIQQIAIANSLDAAITIDRSLSRGSTLVTIGALGTYEYAPISTAGFSGAERKLYVQYSDLDQTLPPGPVSSTLSIDNIRLLRGSGAAVPMRNQPVQDEFIGIGDGSTTAYATDWPYIASSLQIEVAGMLAEIDPSDPEGGGFDLVDPAPVGARITATYRAKGT